MTAITLPDTDLHALFTLLEDARRDVPGEVVPWALLEGLARLIRADSVQWTETDWVRECLVESQGMEGGERDEILRFMKNDETATYFRACRNFRVCTNPQLMRNCQYLWIKIFYVTKGSPEVFIGRVVGLTPNWLSATRSLTATRSSQWGQFAPGPRRRHQVLQSSQRWVPR